MTTVFEEHPVYRIARYGIWKAAPPTYRGAALRFTPGGRQVLATLKEHTFRCRLPYGKWTCADGREVLYNRFYEPIWQRRPGEQASAADPREWVPWVEQEWFWERDRYAPYAPWRNRETLDECMRVLREFTGRDEVEL